MPSEQPYGPVLAVYSTPDFMPPKVCKWCLTVLSAEVRHGNHPPGPDSSPMPEDTGYCELCQEREATPVSGGRTDIWTRDVEPITRVPNDPGRPTSNAARLARRGIAEHITAGSLTIQHPPSSGQRAPPLISSLSHSPSSPRLYPQPLERSASLPFTANASPSYSDNASYASQLTKSEPLLCDFAPDPMTDITRLRVRAQGFHSLYPGAVFQGKQHSGRSSYDVTVKIVVGIELLRAGVKHYVLISFAGR
jgi:hypothetical protein